MDMGGSPTSASNPWGNIAGLMGATDQAAAPATTVQQKATPDPVSGYEPLPQQSQFGSNPWAGQYGQDSVTSMNAQGTAAKNVSTLQNQMSAFSGDGSSYPAMQNSFGLGASNTPGAIPGSASSPGFGATPINITMPDSGSRGFNPWSLQGESNARGK